MAEAELPNGDRTEPFRAKCNCLPACTAIEYIANIDHIKFDADALNGIRGFQLNDSMYICINSEVNLNFVLIFFSGHFRSRQTRLSIFFQDNKVETTTRMEMYTFADFLAICGGLLGLFLGVSALSIVELLYYITLRLFWSIRHSRLTN